MGSSRVRITPGLVVGLAVMLLGVVLTLDNFGVVQARRFVRLWPVALIVLGLVQLTSGGLRRGKGILLMLGGGGLLLVNLQILTMREALPLVLFALGAAIVWRALRGPSGPSVPELDTGAHVELFAVLGGMERRVGSQEFRGGAATAVMGGCEIDLTQARIEGGQAVLNTFAFWGGIDVKVPTDWTVELRGMAVLGGFSDSSRPPDNGDKRLVVTGYALMGGVEVHN